MHEQKISSGNPSANTNSTLAIRIWNETRPTPGTLAEVYLRSRGITMSLPTSLRFHPRLKHPSGQHLPAMVALVTDGNSGTPVAIHRTYLSSNGNAKADATPNKMMLGTTRGGAVRLSEQLGDLLIGEGIETTLSAMQATGRPGDRDGPHFRQAASPLWFCPRMQTQPPFWRMVTRRVAKPRRPLQQAGAHEAWPCA